MCTIETMQHRSYIKVAVTLPVFQEFTYQVPEHLESLWTPGMRVLVPFGRRRVTGYIVSGAEKPSDFKTKYIHDLLDENAMFPESEIEFFKWISDYYLFPFGEVIKAALPAGLEQRDMACVFITEKGKKQYHDGQLNQEENRLIGYVDSKKQCTLKQLKKSFEPSNIHALTGRMEKKNLINITAVLKKNGPGMKLEKYIQLGQHIDQQLVMSKKRMKILEIVRNHQEISLSGLKEDVPTAATLIKPLAKAGYIDITQRQVFRDPLGDPVEPDSPPQLTDEQQTVLDNVAARSEQGFNAYLLFGVTGSGKTEVYMRLVQSALDRGQNAIVLVPEISLISQTERRFRARFGEKIAVIHSSLTRGELIDQWRKIALNKVQIVIGARSAVFAPFENIGIMVVDEEHDSSYKQESGLRYNARDLAVVRAKQHDCPVVLGSATPSVQSYQNVMSNRFHLLVLKKRVNQYPLPVIDLVDLKAAKDKKGRERIISSQLAKAIRTCLKKGQQALIFLNRRGFATYPVCRDCGKTLSCHHCDITMTLHKTVDEYRCHLCGFSLKAPVKCRECGSGDIQSLGFGTQRVESMLKEMFPDARLARMDQDTTSRKGSLVKLLKDIRNRNVDIIVGTQMLAKGHDFPSITLVGVVCADLSLSLPDFRAGERTFQLLAQVAGRAGRGDEKGRVIMQTYNPDHFIIEAAKHQDFITFFEKEVPFRKALAYPPFSRMTQLKISGKNKDKTAAFASKLSDAVNQIINTYDDEQRHMLQIMGPIEAPINKISSRFRWQMLIKSASAGLIHKLVKSTLAHPLMASQNAISFSIDVDPYSLM